MFLAFTGFLEGLSLKGVQLKVKRNFFVVWAASLKLWPAVHVVTFFLVPVHVQVVFVKCVSLGWTTFLSILNARAQPKHLQRSPSDTIIDA